MDGKRNSELGERECLRSLYGVPSESALLLLVRHGETTWNAENRVQGQTDSPLSDLGIAQARCLAERLKDESIHAAYSSDLSRAVETGRIIAEPHGLEVARCSELREADYGDWTGRTMDEVRANWPDDYHNHLHDPANARIPGGESALELMARVHSFAKETAERHIAENVLIAGHGGSVRGILCGILDCVGRLWGFKLNNGGISVVEWRQTGPRILAINDVSHLRDLSVDSNTGNFQESA